MPKGQRRLWRPAGPILSASAAVARTDEAIDRAVLREAAKIALGPGQQAHEDGCTEGVLELQQAQAGQRRLVAGGAAGPSGLKVPRWLRPVRLMLAPASMLTPAPGRFHLACNALVEPTLAPPTFLQGFLGVVAERLPDVAAKLL